MEQAAGIQARPVPAPRRLYPELRPSNYENIELRGQNNNNNNNNNIKINTNLNKKLNIDAENLHDNCQDKQLATSSQNKLLLKSQQQNGDEQLLQPIYSPDANENVDNGIGMQPIYATPKPAPRQRTAGQDGNADAAGASAMRTPMRTAPLVPPKTLNVQLESRRAREQRYSISSEFSTTSANTAAHVGDDQDVDVDGGEDEDGVQSRYTSNGSLNCSESSQKSGKYKSPSPGYVLDMDEHDQQQLDIDDHEDQDHESDSESVDGAQSSTEQSSEQSAEHSSNNDNNLLRSLGTTSKLLGEAIGERLTVKAKGARKRLDRNLKSSTEALSNLSTDAGVRLKHAGKRFGSNFTLGKGSRDGKETDADVSERSLELDMERRQTMPNTDVFNTIQFSSPLNRNAALTDLSETKEQQAAEDSGAYEVPKSLGSGQPPSYDEALKVRPSPPRSAPMARNLAQEAAQVVQLRNKGQPRALVDSVSGSSSCNGDESPGLPMPTFPAPRLSQQPEHIRLQAAAVQPPARQKRRKNYEHIQLRRPQVATSAELQELNRAAELAEREESLLIKANIKAEEARAPKPERSDSWEFYGEDGNESGGEEGESSSPEPVYVNQEATYGKLFEMATVAPGNMLIPQPELSCINEDGELDSNDGAVGGWAGAPPQDLIEEFDPLMSKSSTLARSNKSNELLLLEHLLEEDTYGSLKREQDDVSMCTSEEEPTSSVCISSSQNIPQIVHQNAHLLSDSMEELDEDEQLEQRAKPFLSRLEDKSAAGGTTVVDLSAPSRHRTNWFVGETSTATGPSTSTATATKTQIEGDSPPTYLEAIGGNSPTSGSGAGAAAGGQSPSASSNENRFTLSSRIRQTMNAISNVKFRMDAMKRRTSFKAGAQRQSDVKVALQMVPRPSLSPLLVRYEGPLVRFPSGVVEDILKEMQNRKAILRERQFQTYLDQEMKTARETIPLDTITTVQCVSNSRVTDSATHFYCFEITTSQPKNGSGSDNMSSNPNLVMTSNASGNVKQQRVAHLYGVGKESERGVWMQKILESLTNSLPVKYTCHYYRAGWCYLKNSITSEWSGTWLVLRKSQRRLIFVSESNGNVEKMDLRKARCIVLKESDESIDNLHVESGPMLMIDCPPYSVYMIMSSARETKIWRHIIREVAHNNSFSLADQQLTRYDVPVIVDKCINFVYIHGSMSEGIYRKSGSENSMHKLMSAFRADAFNVEITRNEYNEHDVANVLKRFMRDLPERLLGKLTDSFVFVTELAVATEKIPIYKELLARLSTIEHETLRRIVGHLVFISSQQAKNKMSVQNLTMIWGPTLLAKKTDELIYSQKEADVLSDLIFLYKNLFPCSADEIKREQAMLACLQKYYAAAETLKDAVKQSGDIKIWISLNPNPDNTTEEKTQVNATISPTKTAYELCREYSSKMALPTHQLTLYEVILNDSLERPLHHDAKVFDVILNWSYWPEEDRKHNYLMVRPIEMLREVQRAVKNLATVTPGKELRFADYRTKAFKTFQCELRDGKIVVSKKDKNDKTTIVREIFLHSSTAYLGCERKRDFPWSWAITFVERTQSQIMRSRDAPFIGHVLAGSEWGDRTIWYSSIWYCLHGDNILPPAEIIIK